VKAHPSAFDKCISFWLMMAGTFYTFVLSMVLSAFRCYPQEDGSFTLLPSPSHDCYDSEWYSNLWIIVLGISFLVYLPVQVVLILWKNQKISSNMFFARYGVLVSPYKKQYFYWEVILMMRKLLLICLVDLTNGLPNTDRSFILVCFLFAEMFLDVFLNPFQEDGFPVVEIRNLYVLT
jgi:hypothetical protein